MLPGMALARAWFWCCQWAAGQYLASTWRVLGVPGPPVEYLGSTWKIPGKYLGCTWRVPVKYLELVSLDAFTMPQYNS